MRFQPLAIVIALGAALVGLTGYAAFDQPPPADNLPVGTVLAFAGVVNTPNGTWRLCDGQSLRRSDFPRLYATIGTAWGQGANPGTTFALPDLRGMFLRERHRGRLLTLSATLASHASEETQATKSDLIRTSRLPFRGSRSRRVLRATLTRTRHRRTRSVRAGRTPSKLVTTEA
jgi:microcystin-dependent protein